LFSSGSDRPWIRPFVVSACSALSAVNLGCPGPPKPVVYDLAERVAVADRWSARQVLLFGTPAAEPHQAEGFYREGGVPDGDSFAWSKGEAEVSLTWPEVRERAAVVDLAPYAGVRAQAVEARLNGAPVARFGLNDLRHRYRVPLPAGAQKAGDNRLRFVFASTASPAADGKSLDRRQLAAAFYGLTVAAAEDAGLDDLLARDAPRPFARADAGGIPAFVQLGPSVVRYAVLLPAGAELRFRPALHPAARAAGASASFRVAVEDAQGRREERWSRVLDARDPPAGKEAPEVVVPLGDAGQVVQVALEVGGPPEGRFAWGVWQAPRIVGRSAADGLVALPPGPLPLEDDGKADTLRRDLRGLNVVLIVLDAARAGQLGCYGYGRPTTPEVDRLAAEGVLFERAYTPAVYTLGAMSSVWTSQYPDRHHAEVSYADRLPPGGLTLSEALGARGVKTAGFVANAMAGTAFGFERGFDEFHEVYRLFPDLGSRGEAFRRVLPAWLDRHRARPFFAYVHLREPHFPYDPGPPFDTRFGADAPLTREQRRDRAWYTDVNQGRVQPRKEEVEHLVRLYDGNLAYADREVGELRRALEAAGLLERTVLIVTADHGEQLHEHGYISHSAQVYEQSVHVPLIVRLPAGKGPRGLRLPALVDLLDLAPTVLDLLAQEGGPRAAREFQGRSLLPVIAGAPGKPAVLSRTVWERPVYALRDERYKLIYDSRTGQAKLFDLQADPREQDDLAARDPLRAAHYRQALQQWTARLADRRAEGVTVSGGAPTPEQCENFRALGYVHSGCK
jgi:arylsulfatase A-like enzyme